MVDGEELEQIILNRDESNSLNTVLEYLYEDEKRHYEECLPASKITDHVYLHIQKLIEAIKKSSKG